MAFCRQCGSPVGEHHPEWKKYFDDQQVTGCIEIYDLKKSAFIDYNADRCAQRFIPASAFGICLALIALESKTPLGKGSWSMQEVAEKIGQEKMQRYLNLLHYGNGKTGTSVDSFWLSGDLRISCDEQIEFLKNLYTYQLPVTKRTIDSVKGMMVIEKKLAYLLSGKTGW